VPFFGRRSDPEDQTGGEYRMHYTVEAHYSGA